MEACKVRISYKNNRVFKSKGLGIYYFNDIKDEVSDWLEDNNIECRYYQNEGVFIGANLKNDYIFLFLNVTDAILFKLTWG